MFQIRRSTFFVMFLLAAMVISPFTVSAAVVDVPCDGDLQAAITTANGNGAEDTLTLVAGCTYTLSAALAIEADNNHSLTINGNGATISGNNAVQVFVVNPQAQLILNNVTITKGSASAAPFQGNFANGGGISISGGKVTLNNSTLTQNSANGSGGAVYVDEGFVAGELIVNNSVISNNTANGSLTENGGGAIYIDDGIRNQSATILNSVTISNSSISGNTTAAAGGAIYVDNETNSGGILTIEASSISGNTAAGNGGGILDDGGNSIVTLTRSTVAGNTANGSLGGGIAVFNTGTMTITSSSIVLNTATAEGGGLYNATAVASSRLIYLNNTLVAGNTAPTAPDLRGFFNSQDYNFFGSLNGFNVDGTTTHNKSGSANLDPNGLQNNGGSTQTVALAAGSPAIDAGNCTGTDQRGVNRPVDFSGLANAGNGCDIGAYERENAAPTAANDSFNVGRSTTSNINAPGVLGNDTDADNDTLSAIIVSQPGNGTVTLGQDGGFSYTPGSNPPTTVSFTYKANDGNADSNTATVTLNVVNNAPSAINDSYTVASGRTLTISAPGILGNDTDPDGDNLTANKASDPANGTLQFNNTGGFTYTSNSGFVGTDSFTYRASDGSAESGTATVTINVTSAVPDELTLLAPLGALNNSDGRPLYQWPDRGVSSYEVYLAPSSLTSILFFERISATPYCNGVICEVDLTDLSMRAWLANGSYVVYLCATQCDASSNYIGWKGPFTFAINVGQPAIPSLTAASNLNTSRPTLNWELPGNAARASWFEVYLAPTGNLGVPAVYTWFSREQACSTWEATTCALQVPVTLLNNTQYSLYVRSWGPGGFSTGGIGGWAGPLTFTVSP